MVYFILFLFFLVLVLDQSNTVSHECCLYVLERSLSESDETTSHIPSQSELLDFLSNYEVPVFPVSSHFLSLHCCIEIVLLEEFYTS